MTFIAHLIGILHRIITLSCSVIRCSTQLACLAVFALAAMAVSSLASAQTILRVDIANGSVTGDGSGWGSSAFRFLQDALVEAVNLNPSETNPVEIWVVQGTYRPDQTKANDTCGEGPFDPNNNCCPPYGDCGTGHVFTIPAHVTVLGGFPDDAADTTKYGSEGATDEHRDWEAYPTILSGDLQNSDSVTIYDNGELVLDFQNYSDNSFLIVEVDGATAVLDGFTVRGAIHVSGAEARLLDCIFDVSEGPALRFSRGSSAQIWRCRLTGEDGESLIDRIIAEPDARVFVDALTGFLPLRARSAAK